MSARSIASLGIGFGAKLIATIGIGAALTAPPEPAPPPLQSWLVTGGVTVFRSGPAGRREDELATERARIAAQNEAIILAVVAFVTKGLR